MHHASDDMFRYREPYHPEVTAMVRILLVLVLAGHALAHLPGFLVSWGLATYPELPYRTTVLAGRVEVGTTGIRSLGVVWLLLALGFAGLAAAAFFRAEWAVPGIAAAVVVSLLMSILGWPEARVGVPANLLVAGLLFWAIRNGVFQGP